MKRGAEVGIGGGRMGMENSVPLAGATPCSVAWEVGT